MCNGFCNMPNFPIPENMMGKSRRKYENWKRCSKCSYSTYTELLRCPCCNHKYRKRKTIDKEYRTIRQKPLPIHLRSNVTTLEETNTFMQVIGKFI